MVLAMNSPRRHRPEPPKTRQADADTDANAGWLRQQPRDSAPGPPPFADAIIQNRLVQRNRPIADVHLTRLAASAPSDSRSPICAKTSALTEPRPAVP